MNVRNAVKSVFEFAFFICITFQFFSFSFLFSGFPDFSFSFPFFLFQGFSFIFPFFWISFLFFQFLFLLRLMQHVLLRKFFGTELAL